MILLPFKAFQNAGKPSTGKTVKDPIQVEDVCLMETENQRTSTYGSVM
ncbi:MAG: hypothetical protein HXS40_01470 [Theionarchaea archaeon]|nr:hypothetical protein [Theionarchaea archaeon]